MAKYKATTTVYVHDRLYRSGEIVELPYPASPDQFEPIGDAPMAERRFNWSADTFFDQRHYELTQRKEKNHE